MPDDNYVGLTIRVAATCLMGDGTFEERHYNAWISALHKLKIADVESEASRDFTRVLELCQKYHPTGATHMERMLPEERKEFSESLLRVLETYVCAAKS